MADRVQEMYGNRLRVRACGILVENEGLLMVNHKSLSKAKRDFWAPPGGGVHFGESITECLRREMIEETGLETASEELLFVCEFVQLPLHAVELFFVARRTGGVLKKGSDPEMNSGEQIIQDVRFLSWREIRKMNPESVHGIFRFVAEPSQICTLRGYFKL
jgi:8-oxo-dGTP diphosphatase